MSFRWTTWIHCLFKTILEEYADETCGSSRTMYHVHTWCSSLLDVVSCHVINITRQPSVWCRHCLSPAQSTLYSCRYVNSLEVLGEDPADCWNWGEWGLKKYKWKGPRPSLVGFFFGLSCRYMRFLFCLGCSSQPSTKYFFLLCTLFQFLCPHRPPNWACSRAGSPVS